MTLYLIFALVLAALLSVLLVPLLRAGELPKRQRLRFAAMVCAGFFIGSFGLYGVVGTPEILPLMETRGSRLVELRESIVRHSGAVKSNPDNLGAWVELGGAFMETSQYDAAANAYKRAVVLSGGDPALILAYARAMILEDSGTVSDQSKKSLEMVLLQEPENPEARYFLAVRQLQDGNSQEAMQSMRKLYNSLDDNSPLKAMINRQIGRN